MKRSAALMMAALSLVAMGNVASAAEEEPDRLAGTARLILETDSIVADQSINDEEKTVEIHDYQYGDQLDIQKVIAIESDSMACGVTPATMTYRDSQGKLHALRYQIMGGGCQNG